MKAPRHWPLCRGFTPHKWPVTRIWIWMCTWQRPYGYKRSDASLVSQLPIDIPLATNRLIKCQYVFGRSGTIMPDMIYPVKTQSNPSITPVTCLVVKCVQTKWLYDINHWIYIVSVQLRRKREYRCLQCQQLHILRQTVIKWVHIMASLTQYLNNVWWHLVLRWACVNPVNTDKHWISYYTAFVSCEYVEWRYFRDY